MSQCVNISLEFILNCVVEVNTNILVCLGDNSGRKFWSYATFKVKIIDKLVLRLGVRFENFGAFSKMAITRSILLKSLQFLGCKPVDQVTLGLCQNYSKNMFQPWLECAVKLILVLFLR